MDSGFRACIAWLVVALLAASCGPPGPRVAPERGGGPASSGPTALPKRITAAMMSDPPSISSSFLHHMTDQLTAMGIYYNTKPVMIGNRLMSVTARDVGETTEAWNAHQWELR